MSWPHELNQPQPPNVNMNSLSREHHSWAWPGDHSPPMDNNIVPGTEHVAGRTREAALGGEFIDLVDLLSSAITDCDEFKSFVNTDGIVNFKYQRSKKSIAS